MVAGNGMAQTWEGLLPRGKLIMNCRLFLLSIVLVISGSTSAEIEKCISRSGDVSYKDKPCSRDETRAEIDRDFANELPLATSKETKEVFAAIARERKVRDAERMRRQNEAIRAFSRKYEAKQALCEQYKETYAALLRFKRRNGNLARDYESEVIRSMREACSS